MPKYPTMHLIAGVNGAGKTVFYQEQLRRRTPGAVFVNADEIARDELGSYERAAEAARLAAERRTALLDAGATFVAETVFSHESKLELVAEAKARGFRVVLYHVNVGSAELARARIRTRESIGGHSVPDDKVDARYERSLRLVPQAASLADLTFVYDNSRRNRMHTHIMTLTRGVVSTLRSPLPAWVERAYASVLAEYRGAGS